MNADTKLQIELERIRDIIKENTNLKVRLNKALEDLEYYKSLCTALRILTE